VGLFTTFAQWFGGLEHPHKVLIAGNHDGVLEAMGADQIRKELDQYGSPGSTAYLIHEAATVGGLRVFGSPYGNWGSHNRAFKLETIQYDNIPQDTHIVVTHMPAILPKSNGSLREDDKIVSKLIKSKTRLHISGHCHWAYGLYHTTKNHIPCVVASVCDSEWLSPKSLISSGTVRGDLEGDKIYGGYNIINLPIVCDIIIPGGAPDPSQRWVFPSQTKPLTLSNQMASIPDKDKPTIIFFGPPSDPGTVDRLRPTLCKYFTLEHFEDVYEAIEEVNKSKKPYTVCITKLGTKNNLGKFLIETIRKAHGNETYIILHSATALAHNETKEWYLENGVNMIVDHANEMTMMPVVTEIAKKFAGKYLKK
jgi:hypothetical protein